MNKIWTAAAWNIVLIGFVGIIYSMDGGEWNAFCLGMLIGMGLGSIADVLSYMVRTAKQKNREP